MLVFSLVRWFTLFTLDHSAEEILSMAAPADVTLDRDTAAVRGRDTILKQINNIVASLRLLTAKLDADAGVTDANYAALITDAAVATAPSKIVI